MRQDKQDQNTNQVPFPSKEEELNLVRLDRVDSICSIIYYGVVIICVAVPLALWKVIDLMRALLR